MTIKLGVVMDPIASINYKKDSTLAMLWEADKRGWEIFYFEFKDLYAKDGVAFGRSHRLSVYHDPEKWYAFGAVESMALADLDVMLMRKDPPVGREYIYTTYLLELAERAGVLVVNKPQALRDANEKVFTSWFPQCCPPTLITQNKQLLKEFFLEHEDIICKPLDGMGGASIFRLKPHDVNASVIFETLSQYESQYMMAQKYIPEITQGDKRILMINGEPVSHALARLPAPGEWRGNLAAGAQGKAQALTARDHWICQQVGPVLRAQGLWFVGLDVIGDFLTEINVTSPTCMRELAEQCQLNVAEQFLQWIEKKLKTPLE